MIKVRFINRSSNHSSSLILGALPIDSALIDLVTRSSLYLVAQDSNRGSHVLLCCSVGCVRLIVNIALGVTIMKLKHNFVETHIG